MKKKHICEGAFSEGRFRLGCRWHYNPLFIENALAVSCNSFFCKNFIQFLHSSRFENHKKALRIWRDDLQEFGFGKKISVDLEGESSGYLPDSTYFNRRYPGIKWNGYTIVSMAIGQGEIGTTPLQLANFTAFRSK